MAEPLYLSFVVHNHQPVGNLLSAVEQTFEKAYDPFLSFLEQHPNFLCVLHYSGSLLDWLEENSPGFLRRLGVLVSQGQVELLTGACYEAIAALIPETDLVGQTQELTRRLLEQFGYHPRGFWLSERIWEPHLASALAACGVDYSLVDGENFARAGIEEEDSRGMFVTENLAQAIYVFPINQTLREAIPFELPEKVVERLAAWAKETPGALVVWGDDGEKLGAWPGTHRWVYEEGWLERFFALLQQNSDSVRLVTLRDYFSRQKPLGRVCVPAGSYGQMMEWSNGSFRNFLIRYEESNWMHKRMLAVSEEVAKYASEVAKTNRLLTGQVSLGTLRQAQKELWQGQCNDGFWHGVFGGLYLPTLRRAVYHHLLAAEKIVGSHLGCEQIQVRDFDKDGNEEIKASNGVLTAFWLPKQGGALAELDFLPTAENLLATLRRRREKYHEGMEVVEDWYGRHCFLDHFLREGTDLAAFSRATYGEQGDFVNQPYIYHIRRKEGTGETARLSRQGNVWVGEKLIPLRVEKEFTLRSGRGDLEAAYRVENPSQMPIEVWFGVEMNLALSGFSPPQRHFQFQGEDSALGLDEQGERSSVELVALCDHWLRVKVEIAISPAGNLWFFPIKTLSRSEEGIEEVYQCTALLFHQRLTLPPLGAWEGNYAVHIGPIKQ